MTQDSGKKRRILLKMKTPREVRKTLSRVANMVINGELDTRTANCIVLTANAILNSIRADDIQKQLDKLAAELEQRGIYTTF